MNYRALVFGMIGLAMAACAAQAEDEHVITLNGKQFSPATLTLPAGQKLTLSVVNQNDAPAEFESGELNREKIVQPHSTIHVILGPLDAGTYHYFNDFDRDATGIITVK